MAALSVLRISLLVIARESQRGGEPEDGLYASRTLWCINHLNPAQVWLLATLLVVVWRLRRPLIVDKEVRVQRSRDLVKLSRPPVEIKKVMQVRGRARVGKR